MKGMLGIFFLDVVFSTGFAGNHGLDTVARSQSTACSIRGSSISASSSQPIFNIYSFWGIVWAHLGGTVSVKVMLSRAGVSQSGRRCSKKLHEISGASGARTFFRIVLPVMMPAILVTTILGIIRSLEAFEIELLLGTPIGLQVYSTKIHELVTWEPPQFAPAMALSTVFLGVLLLMVAMQRRYIARRNYETSPAAVSASARRVWGVGVIRPLLWF